MRYRRWIGALLALALALALAACAGGEDEFTGPEYSWGLDKNGHFWGVKARELVTLPEDSALQVPEVTEEEAEAALLEAVLRDAPPTRVTEGTVSPGDTLNIDYRGVVNGVEYDILNTYGRGLEVTQGAVTVPDFLPVLVDSLVGRRVGETLEVRMTLPSYFPPEVLIQGREVVFSVTVNWISVREISDESVAALGYADVPSALEALRAELQQEARDSAVNGLLAGAECGEVPQSVLDTVHRITMLEYQEAAQAQGTDLAGLAAQYGFASLEDFEAEIAQADAARAPILLAAQAVAELRELTVPDEAIPTDEAALARYGKPYLKFKYLTETLVPQSLAEGPAETAE